MEQHQRTREAEFAPCTSQTRQTAASERADPPRSLSPDCPLHLWLSLNSTRTLTINAGAPARLPPMAVKLKGETAATKPCGRERNGTGVSTVPSLTVTPRLGAKKRELRKQGASPSPSPHLQPSVDHAVGADVHAEGLALLQLQGVLGVESEEVYQLRSGIDFRLDDGFTLPGEVVSNEGAEGRVARGDCSSRQPQRCGTVHTDAVCGVFPPCGSCAGF